MRAIAPTIGTARTLDLKARLCNGATVTSPRFCSCSIVVGTKDDGDEIESIVVFGIAKTGITEWPEICVNLR